MTKGKGMSENDNITARTCEWCNELQPSEGKGLGLNSDDWICESCMEDAHTCERCDSILHGDDSYIVEQYTIVCQYCFDTYYFTCDGCGVSTHNDNYGSDDYCNDCYEDEDYNGGYENIREWGKTPELDFITVDDVSYMPEDKIWYMGMEIELEGAKQVVNDSILSFPHLWATTDSSLDNGVEVISHPATFEAWMEGKTIDWDYWNRFIHNEIPEQSRYHTNGIHIHISRTAFNGAKGVRKPSHIYKFLQFIQKHEYAIQNIAGRDGNAYCEWNAERDVKDRVKDCKDTSNYERYRPVNTQNRETLELRFFDGRSDPSFIKRALQLTHAMVEYTRGGKATDKRTWFMFTVYLQDRKDMYPELVQYVNDNGPTLRRLAQRSIVVYRPKAKKVFEAKKQQQRHNYDNVDVSYINDCTCDGCEEVARLLRERNER